MRPVLVVRAVAFVLAALAVAGVIASAVRTLVVPRALSVALSRAVFVVLRRVFSLSVRRSEDYERVDRRMAFYAPTALLALPVVWLTVVLASFAVMYWAVDQSGWWTAIETSGSSLLTLGFKHPGSRVTTVLSFFEAAVGLALVALLITYLPTIYGGFSRRETFVSLMEGRAGNPPWAVTMLLRYQAIDLFDRADELWERAELWFSDVEESHTSLASLVFFRSPQPSRSWVTTAGAVLDGAALQLSALDLPNDPHAALCIRSGFLCLRRIADFFDISHPADPAPTDPISITRDEFDDALRRLEEAGTPIKPDRDQAWRDFQGWRVNYDSVLLDLAGLTDAPVAPWSSDRSPPYHRPPVLRIRKKRAQPST
jgi:hypothetical protein